MNDHVLDNEKSEKTTIERWLSLSTAPEIVDRIWSAAARIANLEQELREMKKDAREEIRLLNHEMMTMRTYGRDESDG